MKSRHKNEDDASESDLDAFEMPETVICVDTICNICHAEFLDEDDLKLHVNQVHLTERSLSRYCQFCASIFASIEEYASHICDVHILNIRCCKYCMRAFSHYPDVKRHEKKHLSYKSALSCSNCAASFNNATELEKHEYIKHKDSKDGVLLQECYSLLSSFLNIRAPVFLQSLEPTSLFTYSCMRCKVKTSDVEYYLQHLHQKNCRSLVCDRCHNVYKKKVGLQRHFASHLECYNKVHDDLKGTCARCNKTFNNNELQDHMKACQAVKCSSCNLIFDTINERANHQANMHKPRFSIKICKFCHKEFVGQVALARHINRSHRKDMHLYKYFCVYCKDIFNHPKKLFSHFFGKHKNLNPFTCKICNKMFKLRKQFTLHIKLDHKSIGTVKFDNNFHVYFTDAPSAPSDTVANTAEKQPTIVNVYSMSSNNVEKTNEPALENDVNLIMCPTTEAEQTDTEKMHKKEPVKRKRKTKVKEYVDLTIDDSDESEEPLIQVKRRTQTKQIEQLSFPSWHTKSKKMMKNRLKFTCKVCKKYCYTYQNFNHHMSLHQTHENKKCIKCPKVFKSKDKLNKHIMKEHSSSKLTETLKNVLARRKSSQQVNENQIQPCRRMITEKFLQTIKKVDAEPNGSRAKVTLVDKLSVKKFIENFKPELNEKRGNFAFSDSVTIKLVVAPTDNTPKIKLTKFKDDPPMEAIKLKQPDKFKQSSGEICKVSIKLVREEIQPKMNFDPIEERPASPVNFDYEEIPESYEADTTDHAVDNIIPEVAQEVMLEGTEEIQKPINTTPRIVIPNLPKIYKDVHVAHLMPEAPYFKIVKIENPTVKEPIKQDVDNSQAIKLPDGTTLINVNPLAHLLEGKKVELPQKKYKPKPVDFEKAIAKALFTNKPQGRRKKIKMETEQ